MGLIIATKNYPDKQLQFDKNATTFLNDKLLEVENHRNSVVKIDRIAASILFVTGAIGLGLTLAFCPFGGVFIALLCLSVIALTLTTFGVASKMDEQLVANFTSGPDVTDWLLREKFQKDQEGPVKYDVRYRQTWDYLNGCKKEYEALQMENAKRTEEVCETLNEITNIESLDLANIIGGFL